MALYSRVSNLLHSFRLLLTALFLFAAIAPAKASHIYGGDMFYTYVSGNTYKITLVIYGDCSGSAFPSLVNATPQVEIYDNTTYITTISLAAQQPFNGVEVTPVCPAQVNNTTCTSLTNTIPGVKKFTYSSNYTLSGTSTNWRFHFNSDMTTNNAGRSTTLTNIVSPGNTYIGLEATLNNTVGSNSSPVYTTIPTPFFCVNVPTNYNPGCVDPNGDDLSFSLVTGFDENVGPYVIYVNPYTATAPLGAIGFSFSSTTGQMTFTPNIVQKSLVVGKVSEYNSNNVLVGTSMREMTFVVLNNCNNNPPTGGISNNSGGTLVNSTTFNICQSAGLFTFNINPTDQNGNNINMTVNGLPGTSTFTITGNNTSSPIGLFSWNVSTVPPGSYTFFVTYTDDGCPLSSNQTIAYTINVLPVPDFNINLVSLATCNKKAVFTVVPVGNIGTWTETVYQGTTTVHTNLNLTGSLTDSLSPGTYTIRVTNSDNCYKEVSFTVAPPPVIIPQVSMVLPTCPGISNGSITILGTNGLAPYQYSIGSGPYSTTNTFTNLAAGTYTLHVLDGNFCIKDTTVTLSPASVILLNMGINRPTCNALPDGSISVWAYNNVGPYQYALGTGPWGSTNTFTNLGPGTYVIHVQSSVGCLKDTTITLTDSVQVHATIPLTNILCNGGTTGSITINGNSGMGPVFTYALGTGPYTTTNTFGGLGIGTYTIHVHDNVGCYLDTTVTLTQPTVIVATPVVTNVLCFGSATGSVTINASGGVPPYTYANGTGPYGGSSTFGGLVPGTYTIHTKDANGCIKDVTITITQPTAIVIDSVKLIKPTCSGGNNGSCIIYAHGGTPGLNYAINSNAYSSSSTITGVTAGTHTLHVKDANNCIKDTIITLLQPTQIVPVAAVTKSLCATLHNGKVVLNASGGTPGYTFAMGAGPYGISGTFNPLASGTYTFHIKDINGCIKDTIITVADSLNPVGQVTITEPLCNSGTDGIIVVTGSGGTNPFTYALGVGSYSTANTFSNLLAGNYILHIQDANGCIKDTTVTVTQPAQLLATVSITSPACYGYNNGSITVNGNGGTPSYLYALNTGGPSSNNIFSNLLAGVDTVHITDAHGCIHDTTVTITQPAQLYFTSLDIANVKCFGESSGQVTVNAAGGTSPFTYASDANAFQSSNVLTGFAVGMHNIYVLDNNNCPIDTFVNITQPTPLYFSGANVTNPTCEGYTDGVVQVSATGGTTPYQYAAGNGSFATADMFSALAEGTYVFYVSDANGCLHDTSITLTGYPHIVLGDNIVTPTKCYGSGDGIVEVIATGGMQPFVYAIGSSASSPSNIFTGLYSGNYEVTITDDKDCSKQAPVYVPQPDSISIHMAVTPNDCQGLDVNGAVIAEVSGGTSPYTYLWSFGDATTQAISKLPNGDYTVTVTDSNKCTSTASATVEYDNCCNPFLPNAFTPNGDGKNDIFRVVFKGDMDLLEFSIYNRFGQRVYTSSDLVHGWDGNFNGQKCDMGTYMYYIRFICGNNSTEKQTLKGDVTLIR